MKTAAPFSHLLACMLVLSLLSPDILPAQTPSIHPPKVEAVLRKAGRNRAELEKAIAYFRHTKDPLKVKAIYFLIANMDIHYSEEYFWADDKSRRIPFNELDYPDLTSSLKMFAVLKEKHPDIHSIPAAYRDIDSMKAGMLIDNVEKAFEEWRKPRARSISFDDFCEYILPYRVTIEPVQNWRKVYQQSFNWIDDSASGKPAGEALGYFVRDYNKWFFNNYKIEDNEGSQPRLGAMQLLHRKKGACGDIADLMVFTLRSQGIPATIDQVPFWATASGKHFMNVCFDAGMKPISFDVSTPSVTGEKLAREPAKVIRITYSKQRQSLAALEPVASIPEGFMRLPNYIDVTKEYWQAGDVHCPLYHAQTSRIAYACVFNFLHWNPAWWGRVNKDSVVFRDMCKGAVFLPMYYRTGKLVPAGYPVLQGYDRMQVLQPDLAHRHDIHLREQAGYLVFRPGKKYRLLYWDGSWKRVGEQVPSSTTVTLDFDRVPMNALLLLLPEYTQHKERPFIIDADGRREWF